LIYTERISNADLNTTSYTKTKSNFLIIGGLIVIVLLSVGFGSYYISFFNLTSKSSKNSNKNQISNVSTNNKISENNSNRNSNIATSTNTDINKINSPNYYFFPESGSVKLLASDVSTLSQQNLALAKNEIFARHGYVFQSEPFKSYFNNKSWYKPNPYIKDVYQKFNNVEIYNVQIIENYENE